MAPAPRRTSFTPRVSARCRVPRRASGSGSSPGEARCRRHFAHSFCIISERSTESTSLPWSVLRNRASIEVGLRERSGPGMTQVILDASLALVVLCCRDLTGRVATLEDAKRVLAVQPHPPARDRGRPAEDDDDEHDPEHPPEEMHPEEVPLIPVHDVLLCP